ncbi:hypothetical protein JCM10207_005536 [Rhodosporidiobolus poonsookiae]
MPHFNCFSPGHDETLPRSFAASTPSHLNPHLPPLQPSPPRSPSRRAAGGAAKSPLKGRVIGAPTGFKHVGHVGGDGAFGGEAQNLAASLGALTGLSSSPMRPTHSAPSSSGPSSPLLAPSSPAAALLGRTASAGPSFPSPSQKRLSLPFADASNRSPSPLAAPSSPHLGGKPRPHSVQPTPSSPALGGGAGVKRKAAPPVTASVIRAVPGGAAEVEQSGPVPTLAKVRAQGALEALAEPGLEGAEGRGQGQEPAQAGQGAPSSVLALQELFTPSEIAAIQHYQDGSEATVVPAASSPLAPAGEEEEGATEGDGPGTRIYKGAMQDIERALREAQ